MIISDEFAPVLVTSHSRETWTAARFRAAGFDVRDVPGHPDFYEVDIEAGPRPLLTDGNTA